MVIQTIIDVVINSTKPCTPTMLSIYREIITVASSPGPLSKLLMLFACNIKSWERGPRDKAIVTVHVTFRVW